MTTTTAAGRVARLQALLARPSVEVAPLLLGAVLRHRTEEGVVAVRLTELEAYQGPRDSPSPDPGSHSFGGKTLRNAVMFGPAGHLYVYFTYGMHYCANMVCGPEGTSSGVLMRAGEVVEGLPLARSRRAASRKDVDLAQGPARLATALGVGREHNGRWALGPPPAGSDDFELLPGPALPAAAVMQGPRVGVSGPGGSAEYPWRFWIKDDPTVSRYKAAVLRNRKPAGTVDG